MSYFRDFRWMPGGGASRLGRGSQCAKIDAMYDSTRVRGTDTHGAVAPRMLTDLHSDSRSAGLPRRGRSLAGRSAMTLEDWDPYF